MGDVDLMRLLRVRHFLWVTTCTLVLSQCVLSVNEEGQLLLGWKESLVDVDNNLGNWDASDATPCLWNGVNCTQGSVSVINFSDFPSLGGPMPPQTLGKFANLTILDVGNSNLSGLFPQDIVNCSKLVTLNLSWSYIGGEVPADISNLKQLEVLDLSYAYFNGTVSNSIAELQELRALWLFRSRFEGPVPESISSMTKLQELTLGYNRWTGTFPPGIFNLPNLRLCYLGDDLISSYSLSNLTSWKKMEDLRIHNATFPQGPFPIGVEKMTQLKYLQLAFCNLTGLIPSYLENLTHLEVLSLEGNRFSEYIPDIFGGMANLTNLFLESNNLSGPLPASLWQCTNLTILLLYQNYLSGSIAEIGNLSGLIELDISMNNFTGPIPPGLGNLIYLQNLNFGWNDLEGEIPSNVADWEQIIDFRLNDNRITGEIPYALGTKTIITRLDFSSNRLQGHIPPNLCRGNQLYHLSLKSNSLTGPIPETYGNCTSLQQKLSLSNNQLEGPVPAGVWGLPKLESMSLNNNYLNGSIDASIGKAESLSWLSVYNNSFSGPLPPEIGNCSNLTMFKASSNRFNATLPYQLGNLTSLIDLLLGGNSFIGSIPPALGNCKQLVDLDLSRNNFDGAIPDQLANLTTLAILDLASNDLAGPIPSHFFSLKQLQTLNVAYNNLSGVIPKQGNGLSYVSVNYTGNPYLCMEGECNNSSTPASSVNGSASRGDEKKIWPIVLGSVLAVVALVFVVMSLLIVQGYRRDLRKIQHTPREDKNSWTVTSFTGKTYHDFEVTIVDEENLIGAGSSGKVYKATLGNGECVAVKKLWGVKKEGSSPDHGFENELRTLGTIRHRHIVKLLCCCTSRDSNLLVYEYMPNGSLGDLLHGTRAASLTWDIRYKIAVGAAMGLQYLHDDCQPRILHRDIKSNNILLDLDYEAHLGDFGISKVVETAVSGSFSTIAGSLGYIAPEYAFSTRVDEKSDIYSFGVVLLELVTGKRAVEPSVFGEQTDLVGWVNNKAQTEEGLHEIFDPNCAESSQEDMLAILRVAMLCTSFMPDSRPSMRETVMLLLKAAPKYEEIEETLNIII